MNADAIILARGGSKGVPGKNMRDIAGRPCIAWTIEHAQRSASITRVIVSSDDPSVLELARSMGAEAHKRKAELSTDTARVDDATRAAAEQMGITGPIAMLYGNVPVRPSNLTDRAVALLHDSGCDSVQSYTRCGKHHPWWTCRLEDGGMVAPWEGDVLNHGVFRRQDLPPAFVPDGGAAVMTNDALFLRIARVADGPHAFFGLDRRGIETLDGEVVDIDSEIDLVVADAVLRRASDGNPDAHR